MMHTKAGHIEIYGKLSFWHFLIYNWLSFWAEVYFKEVLRPLCPVTQIWSVTYDLSQIMLHT